MSVHAQLATGGGANALHLSPTTCAGVALVAALGVSGQLLAPDLVQQVRYYWCHIVAVATAVCAAVIWLQATLGGGANGAAASDFPLLFAPRPFTFEELSWYDGARNSREARAQHRRAPDAHPLQIYDGLVFVAVKGVVYNVSPDYYGPGAGYAAFAAKDSSRQLGKVVVGTEECNADWTTMNEKHVKVLGEWEAKYRSKYSIAGWVVPDAEYYERGAKFAP